MALDGFLELKRGGSPAVEGECRDRTFAVRKAIAINSFEFGTELPSAAMNKEEGEDSELAQQFLLEAAQKKAASKNKPKGPTEFTFRITKDVDSATPQLFRAYCEHGQAKEPQPFDVAVITLRKAAGKEPQIYLVLEFGEVFVATFSINGASDKLPEETIEFTFKKYVRFRYQPQTQTGHGSANIKGWSVANNKPL